MIITDKIVNGIDVDKIIEYGSYKDFQATPYSITKSINEVYDVASLSAFINRNKVLLNEITKSGLHDEIGHIMYVITACRIRLLAISN